MEKFEDYVKENQKVDELLRRSYIEEADALIEEALSDPNGLKAEDIDVDAGFQQMMAELKSRGLYREAAHKGEEAFGEEVLEEEVFEEEVLEEKAAPEEDEAPEKDEVFETPAVLPVQAQKEKKSGRFLSRANRAVATVAIIILGTFTVSMTVEGNREYLLDKVNLFIGNDVQVITANDKSQDLVNIDEERAVQEIKDKIGILTPNFLYRPGDFKFEGYSIDEAISVARIDYRYYGKVVNLQMNYAEDSTAISIVSHGENPREIDTFNNTISVEIFEVGDSEDKEPSYMAQWIYDNKFYQLSGKVPIEEFEKMLNEMMY